MLKLPIRLTVTTFANSCERMRAVLADRLGRRRDAGAVDQADQLAERRRASATAAWPSASWLTSHLTKRAADLGGERLAALGLQVGDDDLAAVRREHARRAFAEARGAAGDDEDLACDVHV